MKSLKAISSRFITTCGSNTRSRVIALVLLPFDHIIASIIGLVVGVVQL